MSKKVIFIRVGDDELPTSRKRFNPMTAKDLEATIRAMNPTMKSFCLKIDGYVCAVNDTLLDSGDYDIEIDTAEIAGPINDFSYVQDLNNTRNVFVTSGVSSSNGTIVTIAESGKLFVLTTAHGILQYTGGNIYLKGGTLSLLTHDGQSLKWLRLYYKNGLKPSSQSWDCCLIEIEAVPDLIPASLTVIEKLLSVPVQNIARIGSTYRVLKGEVIMVENEFAVIPMSAPSGALGCGLFTQDGRLMGIVQSTDDTADDIEITGDVYSAQEVQSLLVKALTTSRHNPVLSRVLVCARVLEMFYSNPATIENLRETTSRTDSGRNSTLDSKNVLKESEKTATVLRDGEVVEIFGI